jgi:hypothetical protein
VESELGRVREEIERMEGRMRFLTDRVMLTTVTITAREQQNYVPAQAPSFTTDIKQTWTRSFRELQRFGRACALFVVSLAPWLPLLALLTAPLVWLATRWKKRPIDQPINLAAA